MQVADEFSKVFVDVAVQAEPDLGLPQLFHESVVYDFIVTGDGMMPYADSQHGGIFGESPGWVRVSLSPTVSEEEFQTLLEAVDYVARHGHEYLDRYELCDETGEWMHKGEIASAKVAP